MGVSDKFLFSCRRDMRQLFLVENKWEFLLRDCFKIRHVLILMRLETLTVMAVSSRYFFERPGLEEGAGF